MALADTKIKQAKPLDKDYKLADEKGLFLLVKPMVQNIGDLNTV
jgi:hypothetical protein